LTVGSLLSYIDKNKDDNIIVYFMPEAPDPCRFGQYHVYTENLLRKRGVENVALLTLSSGNSYGGLGIKYKLRAWQGVVISDVFEEIYSAILSLAVDKEKALEVFDQAVDRVVKSLVDDNWDKLKKVLDKAAIELSQINLKKPLKNATKAAVVGEIYVRRDGFSRQYLVEKLAEKGIVSKVASVSEWVYYCDYLVKNNLSEDADLKDKLNVFVENFVRVKYEKEIKKILTKSNLAEYHIIDVDEVIDNARDLISPHLSGEAILTIGTAITEVIDSVDGVISIGPFGCMPSRIAEAILNEKISIHKGKTGTNAIVPQVLKQYPNLPLLNIETDGNPFPQVIDIKIEAFALQVNRMNKLVSQLKENSINEEAAN
jgi:predicted nucleotide-binding protein (sugar kinase/HSP70/actin superfamily)